VSDEPLISATRVEAILKDCLYTDDEVGVDCVNAPSTAAMGEGILHTYALHPGRLEQHRTEVKQMLDNLPLPFHTPQSKKGGGGGWSFLNACQDANDVQWTGLHRMMEMLFALGGALGYVRFPMPRDVWPALPGGMPYVTVDTST
jgi:hypothetical protein